MKYLSLFSGIEAASVAWQPLGWEPLAFAEIEPFPAAVLAERYPETPNLGDVNGFKSWPGFRPDLIVGGSPCQSFSVAGLRRGLDDPRGQLALTYLAIVDRYRPRWLVWENVPGVLSADEGRAFGAFIGALAELRYGFAWRVLDAQYTRSPGFCGAVPQRRRRLFLVGHIGAAWQRAAAILFDAPGMCWNPPPRREAGQGITHDVAGCIVSGGRGIERTGESRGQDPVIAVPGVANTITASADRDASSLPDNGQTAVIEVANPLTARMHKGINTTLDEGQTPIVVNALQDPISGDIPGALDKDGGTHAIAFDMRGRDGGSQLEGPHDTANIRAVSGGSSRSYVCCNAVRRLTPLECERLQGFPDNWTRIPWRGKPASKCPDGPRYSALGNSMAVNVMRWIGLRIDMLEKLTGDDAHASEPEENQT